MNKVNDELDRRITSRLAERRRKLESMDRWEKKSQSRKVMHWVPLLIAACMIGLVFLIPFNNNDAEWPEASRGANPDIEELVKGKSNEEAAKIIDAEIAVTDSIIKSLEKEGTDEETLYEIEAERLKLNDLKEFRKKIK